MKFYTLVFLAIISLVTIIFYATTFSIIAHSWNFYASGDKKHVIVTMYFNKIYNMYYNSNPNHTLILKTKYMYDAIISNEATSAYNNILSIHGSANYEKMLIDLPPNGFENYTGEIYDCRVFYSNNKGEKEVKLFSMDKNGVALNMQIIPQINRD